MTLTETDVAAMLDLSCVRTYSSRVDIDALLEAARMYSAGQVSVLQCFVPYVKQRLLEDASREGHAIRIVGNVSFPSGSDSTSVKAFQARELAAAGCDEIDTVINVGKLRSGEAVEVEADVRAVVEAAGGLPVKVILEMAYLEPDQVAEACEIAIRAGAAFVKTGTGWAERGTTVEDVRRIKSIVGNRIKIKASGGIRDYQTLLDMYAEGARRFGVNLKSGVHILEECIARRKLTGAN